MGIRGFQIFLNRYAPSAIEEINQLSDLNAKRVGIDVSIYIHQFCHGERGLVRGNYLIKFMELAVELKDRGIEPIFVFDGEKPAEKEHTVNKRRAIKERKKERIRELENLFKNTGDSSYWQEKNKLERKMVHTDMKMYDHLKQVLTMAGLKFVQAEREADEVLADLYLKGKVDYVFSDDMDLLVYGTGKLLTNLIFRKRKVIHFQKFLSELQISRKQFIQMAILAGCDYQSQILSLEDSYNLIERGYTDLFSIPHLAPQREHLLRIFDMYNIDGDIKYTVEQHNYESFRLKTFLLMYTYCNESTADRLSKELNSRFSWRTIHLDRVTRSLNNFSLFGAGGGEEGECSGGAVLKA